MRTLSSNTATETARPITRPMHLVHIVTDTVTYRWCSSNTVTFDGQTWTGNGVAVTALRNLAGGGMEGQISLPNIDGAGAAVALNNDLIDKACRIYELYGDGPYNVADAVVIFDGVCDAASDIGDERVIIDITSAARNRELSPRMLWNLFCNHMPAPGTVIAWAGERYTLEPRDG